jgi:CheY-like chemotaxis protein
MSFVMSSPARVLVVDDSPTLRRVVGQVLRRAGYEVSTAESGETGLTEARATRPDLILLDFTMPDMNGHRFVTELAAIDGGATPVVLLVTRGDKLPETALANAGVVDSVTKPFSPEAILAVVSHRLERTGTSKRGETSRIVALAASLDTSLDAPLEPADALDGAAELEASRVDGTPVDDQRAPGGLVDVLREVLARRNVEDAEAIVNEVQEGLAELGTRALGSVLTLPARSSTMGASLVGDLASVPLPEVLQLLKFQGQTGVLEVELEAGASGNAAELPPRFEVAVKNGLAVAVRARDARGDLLLGHYFVGAGIVSRAQLDAVLSKRDGPAQPSKPVGQRLVEAGLATTEQLRRCVGQQAQDLMVELLRARRGWFGLRRGEDQLSHTHVHPGFSIDMLLFEGLRRIDEWSVIEKDVPSFEARFLRTSDDITDLSLDEIDVLAAFKSNEAMSVNELLHRASLRAFDACRLIYRLVALRRLKRVDDGGSVGMVDDVVPLPLLGAAQAASGETSF